MGKKAKYYVVWQGRKPGVFEDWNEAKQQIEGFAGAQYKSFERQDEAQQAFQSGARAYLARGTPSAPQTPNSLKGTLVGKPLAESLAVDAAWNTATGDVEYQGVITGTKELIFRMGPFRDGTNNIGEFLAIVHGLALLKREGSPLPLYSDSRTAISWVRNKRANTKLAETPRNAPLFELLDRAERWLRENTYTTRVLKWETEFWGENPADFGRK